MSKEWQSRGDLEEAQMGAEGAPAGWGRSGGDRNRGALRPAYLGEHVRGTVEEWTEAAGTQAWGPWEPGQGREPYSRWVWKPQKSFLPGG